ncbi:hypothetical protein OAQ16_04940 [Flavobacteriales bacterium]|nr:hypothetical protein [Flavobacteriales bacterium]
MHKKYIIEKNDLDNLPSSYKEVAVSYSSNYVNIQKKANEINKLKKKIHFLNNDIETLLDHTRILYNQLKFIKKNYLPRIYLKFYTKNNQYQNYVNIVVNYFGVSKTIYLGKKEIVLTSLDIDVNISEKKVKENILELITPIVLNLCSDVKCRLDFNNLSIKSDNLIGSSRKINIKESFSSYLKELNIK